MKRTVWMVLALAAVFFLAAAPFALQSPMSRKEAELESFLNQNNASPEMREAYQFALHHPGILKYLPCYCGCGRQGHRSNLDCFMTNNRMLAAKTPFDTHGLICPICMKIALGAKSLNAQGVPLPQIRQSLDDSFKQYAHVHPTPTPNPPAQ